MTDAATSGYRERWVTAQDGLRLYFRDYGGPEGGHRSDATPVLCLAGVTRNSKDFAALAHRLSARRRVICPDYRGRGRSDYDADWRHYVAQTYVDDVRHLLIACGVHKVHVIGTSLGGILAMIMGVAMPTVLAGVVLNDIGPEVEQDGLAHIVAYMKDTTPLDDWDAVVGHIRDAFPHLPARSPADWLAIAHATYREAPDGRLVQDWDGAIVRPFERALGGRASLWPLFGAIAGVPVLAVRGGLSGVLSQATFERMAETMPAITRVTVDDCGHPTGLNEPHVLEAIDAHLARA